MNFTHWTKLELIDAFNGVVDPISPEGVAALAEYRETGSMLDHFLADEHGNYDADSGPRPQYIVWTGFPA